MAWINPLYTSKKTCSGYSLNGSPCVSITTERCGRDLNCTFRFRIGSKVGLLTIGKSLLFLNNSNISPEVPPSNSRFYRRLILHHNKTRKLPITSFPLLLLFGCHMMPVESIWLESSCWWEANPTFLLEGSLKLSLIVPAVCTFVR